jgi:probable HAF family extracellular repeat protein
MTKYTLTKIVDPDAVPGFTQVADINNSGTVVGEYIQGGSSGSGSSAPDFIYSNGNYTNLNFHPGVSFTDMAAKLINDSGEVVGTYSTDGNSSVNYFTYSGGTFTDLGGVAVNGINDSGALVGGNFISSDGHSGAIINSLAYGYFGGTNATGINNDGDIIGSYTQSGNFTDSTNDERNGGFIITGGTWVQTLYNSDGTWDSSMPDAWSGGTYAKGDVVFYAADGLHPSAYVSLTDGNSGVPQTLNTAGFAASGWGFLGNLGQWSYVVDGSNVMELAPRGLVQIRYLPILSMRQAKSLVTISTV